VVAELGDRPVPDRNPRSSPEHPTRWVRADRAAGLPRTDKEGPSRAASSPTGKVGDRGPGWDHVHQYGEDERPARSKGLIARAVQRHRRVPASASASLFRSIGLGRREW